MVYYFQKNNSKIENVINILKDNGCLEVKLIETEVQFQTMLDDMLDSNSVFIFDSLEEDRNTPEVLAKIFKHVIINDLENNLFLDVFDRVEYENTWFPIIFLRNQDLENYQYSKNNNNFATLSKGSLRYVHRAGPAFVNWVNSFMEIYKFQPSRE